MRTITLYTASELREQFPDAFDKLVRNHEFDQWAYDDMVQELASSLKGLFKACNRVELKDWCISDDYRCEVRVDFGYHSDEVREFTGARAMAWLENNLLANLRIKWLLFASSKKRQGYAGYIKSYRACHDAGKCSYYMPNHVKPCPFTGMCFDEDLIESLVKSVRSGDCLGDAFSGLADTMRKLCESQVEYLQSEEYISERLLDDDIAEYTEDGEQV